ncbi:cytochrome P450 [Streptomyces netropsis]
MDKDQADEYVREFPICQYAGEPVPLPEGPVFRTRLANGDVVWAVTGYEEVRTALSHPLLARDVSAGDPQLGTGGPLGGGILKNRTLLLDGPPLVQLRRLATKPLTARRVAAMRPRIQELTDRFLDAFEETGPPADLMSAVARPLPNAVICELLGIPAEDSARFGQWADRMTAIGGVTQDEVLSALVAMLEYLTGRLEEKRARPGPDLLSAWLAAKEDDDQLTDEEIVQLALAVLVASYESSASAIGACVWRLLREPGLWRMLRDAPELVPDAVQELMRFQSTAPVFRTLVAREDIELGGVTIRRGDGVMPLSWAAHRDPARFEDPDRFDIRRPDNGHIVFGYGPHVCLGAALATAELEVCIGTLLRRFPNLRPAVPLEKLKWHTDRLAGGGLTELPLFW